MEFEIHKNDNPRILLFYALFALLFVVLIFGLMIRQLIQSRLYREQEVRQSMRRILFPGPRGNIFDREGRLLVGNRPRFSAVVYLNELRPEFRKEYIHLVRQYRKTEQKVDSKEIQITARMNVVHRYLQKINKIIGDNKGISRNQIERHFHQNLILPLKLVTDLTFEEYAQLVERIPIESPIQINTDSSRFYPFDSASAHALGFVVSTLEVSEKGVPGEDLRTFTFKGKRGRTGIESTFDDTLQGTSGGEIWIVDPSGFQYELVEQKLPVKGKDITLSIDIDLQIEAEKVLGNKVGAIVALDAKTGEVYALASKPDFNLNDVSPFLSYKVDDEIRAKGAWLNRATQGLYPPASAFKLITAITAFRAGAIGLDSTFICPGYLRVGNRTFHCHKYSGHGKIDLVGAIQYSCNVYFYEAGLASGIDLLSKEAKNFGFDVPTGIELKTETKHMIVPDPAWKKSRLLGGWSAGETANIAIGHGYLRVTPLQMATFIASFSRKEMRTRPTLLFQTNRSPKSAILSDQAIVIDDKQYQSIIKGMELAVEKGTAKSVRIPGLRIAGKTGTAQFRADNKNLDVAWFIGFAPIEDPQIAIAVCVQGVDPDDNYAGGKTAGPLAKSVLQSFFQKRKTISDYALTAAKNAN